MTAEVRALLLELDNAFQKHTQQTEQLANLDLEHTKATVLGAEREHQKVVILGIAWRLNQASVVVGA